MRTLTIGAAALGVAALTLTTPAIAQVAAEHSSAAPAATSGSTTSDSRRTGFMLGVHSVAIPGLAIGGGDMDGEYKTTFGGGVGVTVGYGVNRLITLFTTMDLAKQKSSGAETPPGDWALAHLELGARANVPLGPATTPYVTASYGARALAAKATSADGETFDASISGKYVSVGAGIERAISRSMSLDGGVDVGLGKFSHFKAATDEWDASVNSTRVIRLRLGVTWRPGTRHIT